jgi:hypothetical protein
MAAYRRRSPIIEAQQWFPGQPVEGVLGFNPTSKNLEVIDQRGRPLIIPSGWGWYESDDGLRLIWPSDFLITHTNGTRTHLSEQTFRNQWEEVA